jgi:hypothetical protein
VDLFERSLDEISYLVCAASTTLGSVADEQPRPAITGQIFFVNGGLAFQPEVQ